MACVNWELLWKAKPTLEVMGPEISRDVSSDLTRDVILLNSCRISFRTRWTACSIHLGLADISFSRKYRKEAELVVKSRISLHALGDGLNPNLSFGGENFLTTSHAAAGGV
jgi:hypothetical protein